MPPGTPPTAMVLAVPASVRPFDATNGISSSWWPSMVEPLALTNNDRPTIALWVSHTPRPAADRKGARQALRCRQKEKSEPSPRLSVVCRAAVDVDGLPGDEAAVVADQKQAGGGDLVDLALAPERDAGGARRAAVIPFWVGSRCVDAARRDDIDADIVRGEFGGEAARQPDQAHLGRRDVCASGPAAKSAVAAKEQDAPVAVFDHRGDELAGQIERA